MSEQGRVLLRVTNALDDPRTVVLEPWTTELVLPPGATCEIEAHGDTRLPLAVELHGDTLTISCFDSVDAEASIRLVTDGEAG